VLNPKYREVKMKAVNVEMMLIVEFFTTLTILVAAAGNLATTLEKAVRTLKRLKKAFQA